MLIIFIIGLIWNPSLNQVRRTFFLLQLGTLKFSVYFSMYLTICPDPTVLNFGLVLKLGGITWKAFKWKWYNLLMMKIILFFNITQQRMNSELLIIDYGKKCVLFLLKQTKQICDIYIRIRVRSTVNKCGTHVRRRLCIDIVFEYG